MIFRRNGQPHAIYTRDPNAPYMNDAGKAACRLPSGHPEAFFEAFANIYRAAYDDMVAARHRREVRARRTRSIRTSTTASKGCTSSSSASPAAPPTARGCR